MDTENDPFDWDVGQVIKYLTQPGSPWETQSESIAERIREEGFDGHTLLTFEQTCPREELYPYLDVRRARQKVWLEQQLVSLRAESQKYRKWTYGFKKQKALGDGHASSPELTPKYSFKTLQSVPLINHKPEFSSDPVPFLSENCTVALPTPTHNQLTPRSNDIDLPELPIADATLSGSPSLQTAYVVAENFNAQVASSLLTTTQVGHQNIAPTEVPPAQADAATHTQHHQSFGKGIGNENTQLEDAASLPLAQTSDAQDALEPPRKKKKLAPTNIAREPLHKVRSNVQPWESSSGRAYLGKGALSTYMIRSSFVPVSTKLVILPKGGFAVTRKNRLPPGRRLVVNRTMNQLLRKNGRKEERLRTGTLTSRDSSPSDEDEEDIFDLENLPDLDEATLKEIEDEEKSNEEAKKIHRQILNHEVQAILDDTIEGMAQRWRETKLIKYQRKAYRLWVDARKRHNSLRERIEKHQKQAAYYDKRIKKLSIEIVTEVWFKKEDIVGQAQCLEQSLEDKLYNLWLAGVLESSEAPPPPDVLPRPARRQRLQRHDPMEELLTSTDEESDFVVSGGEEVDGVPGTDGRAPNPEEPVTPIKSEESRVGDRMQLETEGTAKRVSYIDLTSPARPSTPPQASLNPGCELPDPPSVQVIDMAAIARYSKNHWRTEDDRWRLALHILLNFGHEQRTHVLDLIRDKSDEDIWDTSIEPFSRNTKTWEVLENSPPDLRNYHLCSVFLSFVKCKILGRSRVLQLNKKDKGTLLKSRTTFEPFCKFIRSVLHLFPKETHIYRRPEMDKEAEETGTPKKKSSAKEIVQNRAAAEMRERQNEMLQVQQERRAKLRSDLATSGIMSHDKSRLIINETKDENQSFIYINDDIGSRIKDHQIDGVRFLWNQIIQDPSVRQGCLLAHTMGLGKTMQVITFLVAIAEAIASTDQMIQSQIPVDLRSVQTLILCPSGLVNNWMDELLTWAPSGLLEPFMQVDSTVAERDRQGIVENWAANGGVLVIGYDLFKNMHDSNSEIRTILRSKPNIVVADEAHKMKNQETKLSKACANFNTTSRIALTGSPLANNVEEYYYMINWVAPNFLGPIDEFRDIYGRVIEEGLYKDSDAYQKKRAMKMLQVLKETVAPKINRATVKSCLAEDLPPKTEYVISVAPTPLQCKLYNKYLEEQHGSCDSSQIFSTIDDLGLICNHPRCFREKVLKVKNGDYDAKNESESYKSFPKAIVPFALKETNSGDNSNPDLSMKVELLNIILDQARAAGDKVLVFSQSIPTLNYLQSLFQLTKRRFSRLDGKTNPKIRQGDTKAFNEGDKELYLISTKAGGVGLNIQGANRVVLFDAKWNPVDSQQAVGRAYRLGQKKKVFVYHFIVAGTFEDNLHNKAIFKQQLAQRVVDKKNPINWSARRAGLIHTIKPVERKSLEEFQGQDTILDCLISHQVPSIPDGPVCKIVSADTFEEEDTVVVLTEEERKEADSMVSMNRLRQTNPAEYEKLRSEQQAARVSSAYLTQQPYSSQPWSGQTNTQLQGDPGRISSSQPPGRTQHFSNSQPQSVAPQLSGTQHHGDAKGDHQLGRQPQEPLVNQNQTGQSTGSPAVPIVPNQNAPQQSTNGMPIHGPAPVPKPILGANTSIGRSQVPSRPEIPTSQKAQTHVSRASSGPQENLFAQPPKTLAKETFQAVLVEATNSLHARGMLPTSRLLLSAESICSSIHEFRDKEGYGFLPDDQHWRQLKRLLANDRFVLATLSGQLSCKFLALAVKNELERRVDTLSKLSEAEFATQMERSTRTPDPQNLRNISRGTPQKKLEGVAGRDIKIMREAADNRRKSVRTPSSANDSPPGNTEPSSQQS
ncbi:unnamed protein product [Clonostachys rhizophaga]|uniref:Uncharacterized protein n=1 Tax=Clonostachys rhizophaga TaxID=160324 RepID=A0A9N9V168_9HYPO|nr:unnamed protein product [Clonostachys rhizophaga]